MSDLLAHYCDLWGLSDPEPLATTATSHVYTVLHEGERVVLKCLTPYGVEERQGAKALRCFNGQGAVRLLRYDDDAHLLEYANSESLAGIARSDSDENATRIIADVLNTLHAASPDAGGAELVPLRVWFRSLFNQAEKDRQSGSDTIYIRAASIADDLLSHPRDVSVLHGDIHHENIRFREGRGWLVFDPKGLIGERTYDVTNIFCNPYPAEALIFNQQRVLKTADILAETMNLEASRILVFTFAYVCLNATWYMNEGQEEIRAYNLRMAHLIEPLLSTSL